MKNPYWNRTMIREPRYFFGRKKEVRQIFDAIGTPHPQNISVLGERKTGKSSLLYYIFQSNTEKQELPHPEKYIFVFIDFQEYPNIAVDEFFEMLYSELKSTLPKEVQFEQVKDYETFTNMAKTLEDLSYKLILLIDEFDKILQNENFEEDFFSYLRSIVNRYDTALIISTQKDLEDLSRPDLLGSPFFNIFTQIRLGLFQKEEALNLITGPSAEKGIPLEKDAEFILENAGLFPFFIQILCFELFEYRKNHDKKIDQEGYNQALKKFSVEATPHFNHFWKSLSQEEKDVLIEISMEKEVTDGKKSVIRDLEQKGYIAEVNGRNQIFSDTFRQFILDHQEEISDIGETETKKHEIKGKSFIAASDILIFILAFIIAFLGVISYFMIPDLRGTILSLIALAAVIGICMYLFFFRKRRKKEITHERSSTWKILLIGIIGLFIIAFLVNFLASHTATILTPELLRRGIAAEVSVVIVIMILVFILLYVVFSKKIEKKD
ncbi:MAG: hypothetical protein AYK19_20165 [Theionarchaea archaeon DG-70-1]|nr:MAG: hypothetical protein AYK19_20165 [Theionarchaea archaeon DG-70-1]